MQELTTHVATTPEEVFISDEHRAINTEKVLNTLLARTEGIAGIMHSAAISDAPLDTTQVALACEQIGANLKMLSDVIEEMLFDVDLADGMITTEDVLRNMAAPSQPSAQA